MVVQSLFYLCIVVFVFLSFVFVFLRFGRVARVAYFFASAESSRINLETFLLWANGHSQTFSDLSTWETSGECRITQRFAFSIPRIELENVPYVWVRIT